MEFITADPVRINQIHRELSSAKTILPFNGFRSIGLGIADPLSTPIRKGLPIPLREASSSVMASESIPSLVDNNSMINNSDTQVTFMEPTDIRKDLTRPASRLTGTVMLPSGSRLQSSLPAGTCRYLHTPTVCSQPDSAVM